MQENDIITDGATRFKVRKMSPYERIEQLESTVNTLNGTIEKMRNWINNFSAAPNYNSIINVPQSWETITDNNGIFKSNHYVPATDGVIVMVFSGSGEGLLASLMPAGGFPIYVPRSVTEGNWQTITCFLAKGQHIECRLQGALKCEQLNFAPLYYEQQQEV